MRRLTRSIGFLLLSQGVNLVAGVLILALSARYLGPARFGQQAVLRAIALVALPLMVGGMRVNIVKRIAQNPQGAASYLGNVLTLRWTMTVLIAVAGAILARSLPLSLDLEIAAYATILLVVSGVSEAIARAIFTAYERNEYNLAVSIANGILTIPMTLLAIRLDTGVAGILGAAAVVHLLTAQAASLFAWRRFVRPELAVNLRRWREILRESLPVGCGALLRRSYTRVDVWLLAALRSSEAAGIFSVAHRVAVQVSLASVAVGTALLPRLSLLARTSRDQLRIAFERLLLLSLAVSIPAAGLIAACAGPLVSLVVGPKFADAVEPLRLIAIAIVTALPDALLFFCLVALGREMTAAGCLALGLAANIVLDVALIPSLGVRGACLGTIGAEWLYFSLSLAFIHRALRLSSIWQYVGKPVVAGLAMGFVVYAAGPERPVLASLLGLATFLLLFLALRGLPRGTITMLRPALAAPPPEDVPSALAPTDTSDPDD